MGVVTVITSGKGGVGKSTLTTGLGLALVRRGRRVLLIDGDAGLSSLDHMLGVSERQVFNIADMAAGEADPSQAIYPCEWAEGLFLLPAPGREEDIVSPEIMKRMVSVLSRYYDHVLIDCPAGVGSGFMSAVASAQRALVVSTPFQWQKFPQSWRVSGFRRRHRRIRDPLDRNCPRGCGACCCGSLRFARAAEKCGNDGAWPPGGQIRGGAGALGGTRLGSLCVLLKGMIHMNIALIAHDAKKELMVQFCIAYCGVLSRHFLCATGTTGKMVAEATGLEIQRFLSGSQGGDQQIAARIACNEVDLLLFFRDPLNPKPHEPNDMNLLRLCDMHNIPVATNIATAEVLIHGLERGDLDWRNILNPKG